MLDPRTGVSEHPGHFGGHAADYARHRPGYPEKLIAFLLDRVLDTNHAWDCGTGNGQTAVRLSQDFGAVLATDISQAQLDEAPSRPNIEYRCYSADHCPLPDRSVSLITCAAAAHWFDLDRFYKEAQRVLKPQGLIALWTYAPDLLAPTEVGEILGELAREVLKDDWPSGIEWVHEKYQTLPFPFQEVEVPNFDFQVNWSLSQMLAWVDTWSAVRRHRARTGRDPLASLRDEMLEVWPHSGGETIELRLPLYSRMGTAQTRA